MIKVILIKF